jgi:hypothetical protein
MPETEARPPAQNRHGGAPRGERPDRKGTPRASNGVVVATRNRDSWRRLGAPLPSVRGIANNQGPNPRAQAPRERKVLCGGESADASGRCPATAE